MPHASGQFTLTQTWGAGWDVLAAWPPQDRRTPLRCPRGECHIDDRFCQWVSTMNLSQCQFVVRRQLLVNLSMGQFSGSAEVSQRATGRSISGRDDDIIAAHTSSVLDPRRVGLTYDPLTSSALHCPRARSDCLTTSRRTIVDSDRSGRDTPVAAGGRGYVSEGSVFRGQGGSETGRPDPTAIRGVLRPEDSPFEL
jgi:hypothetical protein